MDHPNLVRIWDAEQVDDYSCITMELINGGEINFLRTPGLSLLSLQFSIPQVKYPFAQYVDGFQTADIFINKL